MAFAFDLDNICEALTYGRLRMGMNNKTQIAIPRTSWRHLCPKGPQCLSYVFRSGFADSSTKAGQVTCPCIDCWGLAALCKTLKKVEPLLFEQPFLLGILSCHFRFLEILLFEGKVGPMRAFGAVEQTLNRQYLDARKRAVMR